MKWVTRARPKIDRIACPWLVTRFIDQQQDSGENGIGHDLRRNRLTIRAFPATGRPQRQAANRRAEK
ncbi:chromate resistance protein ChrB domain-containing protein [Nitrospirillum bahiense]|uniref:chromate resistance protein ChrB domain-containing protein n=1 Tax=Nitrospirillum amazonense TaxID=28077 RepID=UPI003CCC5F6D